MQRIKAQSKSHTLSRSYFCHSLYTIVIENSQNRTFIYAWCERCALKARSWRTMLLVGLVNCPIAELGRTVHLVLLVLQAVQTNHNQNSNGVNNQRSYRWSYLCTCRWMHHHRVYTRRAWVCAIVRTIADGRKRVPLAFHLKTRMLMHYADG